MKDEEFAMAIPRRVRRGALPMTHTIRVVIRPESYPGQSLTMRRTLSVRSLCAASPMSGWKELETVPDEGICSLCETQKRRNDNGT